MRNKTLNFTIKTIGTIVSSILAILLVASPGLAHGGGDEYQPLPVPESETSETSDTSGSNSFLPYAVGGSVIIVGAVAGIAVWQRRKNS